MDDLGVNLAGVEVILKMLDRIAELQERLDQAELDSGSVRESDEQ